MEGIGESDNVCLQLIGHSGAVTTGCSIAPADHGTIREPGSKGLIVCDHLVHSGSPGVQQRRGDTSGLGVPPAHQGSVVFQGREGMV